MGRSISEPLLESANEGLHSPHGRGENSEHLACAAAGCGLSDVRSRAEDAQNRSSAARKLGVAVVLCLIFIAVEVAGGLMAHSLAVITDAAHLLSDVAGFAISLFAIWASSWDATPRQSYGFFRLEILGALLSIQLIWLLTGIIVYEAIYRIIYSSQEVNGRLMFLVATFGFFVNVIMVFLLGHHGHSHGHSHHGHMHGEHGHSHGHSHHGHMHGEHGHSHGLHNHAHVHGSDHGSPLPVINENADNHSHEELHDHDHRAHDSHYEHGKDERHLIAGVQDIKYDMKESHIRDSFKVDIDIKQPEAARTAVSKTSNINVKGAWLHVLGDLIQSIGVMIGGAVIWIKPAWRVVDLICTLFFSVLVLVTTIRIIRDVMEVLMESTPREIDAKKLEKGLCEITGVIAVHDLHIWAITMGKTLLACHVTIYSDADADAVLQRVIGYCADVFNISHVTFQIERQQRRSPFEE